MKDFTFYFPSIKSSKDGIQITSDDFPGSYYAKKNDTLKTIMNNMGDTPEMFNEIHIQLYDNIGMNIVDLNGERLFECMSEEETFALTIDEIISCAKDSGIEII